MDQMVIVLIFLTGILVMSVLIALAMSLARSVRNRGKRL